MEVCEGDPTSTTNNFVGRERELAELVAACESGADSDTHLFLISGEPGIGKTRLADELASRVKARGLQVLWGRCWEGDGAPAYWPWIQVIRSFLNALDSQRRTTLALESEIATDMIHEVAQIVPELRYTQSNLRPSITDKVDPNEARFRLFDAVTNFLKIGARSHPMLIVLDDLHDADEASLALLRFMARELKATPILIVATYRDVEVQLSPSLSALIGEISREARPIPMRGLSPSEVMRFVQVAAGHSPDDSLVAKLRAATNGNPLFLDGVVRILIAEGAIDSAGAAGSRFQIPVGVREAIRRQLGGLSAEANALLTVAAAIGNEFDSDLSRRVAEVSRDAGRGLLDEASRIGVVTELSRGLYRFSHALIREAVYEELDAEIRVRLHAKIANQSEELYRENIESHVAELAHHFREAGVTGKAIDYSIRAGQAAQAVFAFTDAVAHWQAALERMEKHGSDARQRADLLGSLADVAFEIDHANSVHYGESAIALYESIGCFDKAADRHIHLGFSFAMTGQPLVNRALASEHLRRAESLLAKGPEAISSALLYAAIAVNESERMDLVQGALAGRRAMEISDRLGDKAAWAEGAVGYARCLVLRGQLEEGFALLGQAFEAAVQANSPGFGVAWSAGGYSRWLGDPRGARRWFELELNRPRNVGAPFKHQVLSFLSDMTYLEEGQLGEARRRLGSEHWGIRFWVAGEWEAVAAMAEAAAEASERTGDRVARFEWSIALGGAYLILGEYTRAEAPLMYGLDNEDRGPLVIHEMRARPPLALTYLAMNRLDAAAEQVARCRQIMAAGEDWRGRAGDVARAEAVVAAASGNYDTAYRQFEAALAIHQKYHLAWEEAQTLHYWGRALAAAGDLTQAAEKFDAALENHRSRGVGPRFLEWLRADKLRALGPTQTGLGGADHLGPTRSKAIGAFRKEGEFWTISYRGATFRLKDAKGLHYIAYLLARPGQRIHVYDLIEAVEGSAANERTTIHAESEDLEIVREIGGLGATIDGRARSEYRARLRDLQADLDEAERMNDLGRSQRLRSEIEVVGQELTGSSGLGGHARASGSVERARGMVARNIRSVVEKIRHQHPALGRHLAATFRTGYFCAYQAEPDHISWQV